MTEQLSKGNINKSDAVQIAFLLLVAGNATMINMINLGVIELIRHPDQKKELIENPALAPKFVEELCRYHTASAMAMKRVAKEDIELGGKVRREVPSPSFFRSCGFVLGSDEEIIANQGRRGHHCVQPER